jgi:exosome complex component RRP42
LEFLVLIYIVYFVVLWYIFFILVFCTKKYLATLPLNQVTVSRIGNHCIIDPTPEEEACSAAHLVMGVTPKGRVTTLRKLGSGSFHQQTLTSAIDLGKAIVYST